MIVAVCFAVEISVISVLQDITTLSPVAVAVIDAVVISICVLVCLYLWARPTLSGSQRRVSDQNYLLETLIDAMPVPVFYKDENGVYTGCNSPFARYLGLPKERIVGQTVYGVAPEELARVYHKADMDLMHQGERQVYEAPFRTRTAPHTTSSSTRRCNRSRAARSAASSVSFSMLPTATSSSVTWRWPRNRWKRRAAPIRQGAR
ncbi:MAG: PAS domain-containing protein [Rhodospirillaceae bacterium]